MERIGEANRKDRRVNEGKQQNNEGKERKEKQRRDQTKEKHFKESQKVNKLGDGPKDKQKRALRGRGGWQGHRFPLLTE